MCVYPSRVLFCVLNEVFTSALSNTFVIFEHFYEFKLFSLMVIFSLRNLIKRGFRYSIDFRNRLNYVNCLFYYALPCRFLNFIAFHTCNSFYLNNPQYPQKQLSSCFIIPFRVYPLSQEIFQFQIRYFNHLCCLIGAPDLLVFRIRKILSSCNCAFQLIIASLYHIMSSV